MAVRWATDRVPRPAGSRFSQPRQSPRGSSADILGIREPLLVISGPGSEVFRMENDAMSTNHVLKDE